jgi:hypothetical protein
MTGPLTVLVHLCVITLPDSPTFDILNTVHGHIVNKVSFYHCWYIGSYYHFHVIDKNL